MGGLVMKKKLLAFITATMSVIFAFSLAACNGGNETTDGSGTHTHTYSEQWSHNDSEHWHTCTGADCDEVIDKAAHTWDRKDLYLYGVQCDKNGRSRNNRTHLFG